MTKTDENLILSYLRLMRFPNAFTAMADVLAGYLIVMGSNIDWIDLLGLLLASTCVYSAGCVLNDISDRIKDAVDHPLRPIPSGKISVPHAVYFSLGLSLTGLICVSPSGSGAIIILMLIILFSILYNFVTKNLIIIGPLTMAACRAFNLVLGMSQALSFESHMMIFPFITFCYVLFITALSRFEERANIGKIGAIVFGSAFILIMISLYMGLGLYYSKEYLIFFIILLLLVCPPLLKSLLRPETLTIARAVTFLILGIPILDAIYVSANQGLLYGFPVAMLTVPSVILSQFFYVT
ncbi:putative Ubiquinone biosynthesis protein UbiA [uncultured Desulfobacterium sp.]|uniref:Putative Ubiquinone biosynthesis protein UbiA n=1 Tax=uncultured Desulfobacterium sp. TaxID=201089 RepID=A0A445N0X8_9BACT|nr:putative Ubiquinone biosynthesis protein UbiA [uncultured Desulfobacterium sp.]